MSAPDWDMVAKTRPRANFGPPPARDMDITDGQKLTLGSTTLTFYLTPGHTPGTISFLVPVTDRGKPHLLSFWAEARFRGRSSRAGRWAAPMLGCSCTSNHWSASSKSRRRRRRRIHRQPPIPRSDLRRWQGRQNNKESSAQGGRSESWIGRSEYIRYMLISVECTEALTGWIQAGKPQVRLETR